MDEIKKVSSNTQSPKVSTNSKDNYTLLKDKYAKFLTDMQKSEMNNSITRYENELGILYELIAEAKKLGNDTAVEEYTKKAEEIEKKISTMTIEILPAINNGLFYRPAINIVPDKNDGSREEKIYSLSKFYKIDEKSEEIPIFSKKQIKEIIKNEAVYNNVIALTKLTDVDEDGFEYPRLSAEVMIKIASNPSLTITDDTIERFKKFEDTEEIKIFKKNDEYSVSELQDIFSIVQDDETLDRACSLIKINVINTQNNNAVTGNNYFTKNEIIEYSKDKSKYEKVQDLIKLHNILKKTNLSIDTKEIINRCLSLESEYKEVSTILSTIQNDLDDQAGKKLIKTILNENERKSFLKIKNIENENKEKIFSSFDSIIEMIDQVSGREYEKIDENVKNTINELSLLKNDKGQNLYSDVEIAKFFNIAQIYDTEEILELAKINYTDANGKVSGLIDLSNKYYIEINDNVISDAKKLANITHINEKGEKINSVPKQTIMKILENANIIRKRMPNYSIDNEVNKISKFYNLARTTHYTDINSNTKRILEEADLVNIPFAWAANREKEDFELIGELLNLTMDSDGKEVPIFSRTDLIQRNLFDDLPRKKEMSANYFHNIKELVNLNKRHKLIINNDKTENTNRNILSLAKKYSGKIDENFMREVEKLMKLEIDGKKLISGYIAVKSVMSGVTSETLKELKELKIKNYDENTGEINEKILFSEYDILSLFKSLNQIENIKKIIEHKIEIEPEKEISLFNSKNILNLIEKNPDFEYTKDFDDNLNKIKEIITKDNFSSEIANELLLVAQDAKLTDKLLTLSEKLNNNINLSLYLINNETELSKDEIDKVNTLSQIQIKNSLYGVRKRQKEYTPAFSNSELIKYAKDEEAYEKIQKFAKLFVKTENGKKFINEKASSQLNIIARYKIDTTEEQLKKFNELSNLKLNGKSFIPDELMAQLVYTINDINKLKELSSFTKTTKNGEEYIFSQENVKEIVNTNLADSVIEYANIFRKNGKMLFDSSAILECIKTLTEEEKEKFKQIVQKSTPDNLEIYDALFLQELSMSIKYDFYFESLLKGLDKFNGDLVLAKKFGADTSDKDYEKINVLKQFYSYDENNNKFERIVSNVFLNDILKDEKKYEKLLKCLNFQAKEFNGTKIIKFDKNNLVEIIKNIELADIITNELPKRIPAENLSKYTGNDLLVASKFLFIKDIKNINELSLDEKRKLISSLIATNAELFESKNIKQDFPLMPTNQKEYCDLLPKVVKSIGIETSPLEEKNIQKFFNQDLKGLIDNLEKINLDDLEIKQKMSSKDLIEEILAAQKEHNISDSEMRKVFDYFCFEIKDGELLGYPANINNGKKLIEIENENTKNFINNIVRNIIIDFTKNNEVSTNFGTEFTNALNSVLKVMPELQTIITKESIYEENTSVFKHSLKMLKEITNTAEYQKLTNQDKNIVTLATLLHNISIGDTNTIAKESAFDSFFLCKKFNLGTKQEAKLYDLIKFSNWNTQLKNSNNPTKVMEDTAFNLRSLNSFDLSLLIEKAKIKNTTSKKLDLKNELEKIDNNSKKIKSYIKDIQKTQPMLPNTKLPKSSEIKEGKGVTKTKDGVAIIKLNEVEDFEAIGFPKGTTKENIKILVHGLDRGVQLANFNTFSLVDSDALLSTSYIIDPYNEYRVFRPQGIILETDTLDVHAGSNMDYGSGCKKNIDVLKDEYIFKNARRGNDRTFFSDLVKVSLGSSDEEKKLLNEKFKSNPKNGKEILQKEAQRISDEKYIEIIEKYQNMTFAEIQNEDPNFAKELVKIFDIIENCNRRNNRQYNEVLVTRPKIQGVFMFDNGYNDNQLGNNIQNELYDYAKENNFPIIIFGNKDIEEIEKYKK